MINRIFNSVNYLERGLDAAWTRNQVITNNIANEDTPGFKASSVEFESLFREAIDEGSFVMKKTNARHLSSTNDIGSIEPIIMENENGEMRMDGNNVDIDHEMNELSKNTIYYNTLTQKYSKQMGRLKLAITEGR